MPNKNPHIVSYDDLIDSTQQRVEWMMREYPRLKMEGKISDWTATHNLAVEKAKLKLFRKFKREPQIDLFKEHEKLK